MSDTHPDECDCTCPYPCTCPCPCEYDDEFLDPPIDEFADRSREVHALIHGFYDAVFAIRDPDQIPSHQEVQSEVPYYKVGYITGFMVREYYDSRMRGDDDG
jgi:hypothetical protein